MASFKTIVAVQKNGRITLDSAPFQAGDQVEVIVKTAPDGSRTQGRFPLRGTPYRYERPFDPALPAQ
ncbi:MAG: hypothetical protein HUU16_17955 [Candidatus Omnitrophica bacterium]|nr:hypothetical protein [Candidatus Omnitrophota bacterium]